VLSSLQPPSLILTESSNFVAAHNAPAYLASKHAVLGLTDALRSEMPAQISVGMIAPGFVATELILKAMRDLGMPG
jgi:NAD(P)-dependent dehydrogenase (short-subunit alcohol dehydrogenase family)